MGKDERFVPDQRDSGWLVFFSRPVVEVFEAHNSRSIARCAP